MNQALFESWLTLQCRAIPGVRVALARIEGSSVGSQVLMARAPADVPTHDDMDDMLRLAQRGCRTVVAGATDVGDDSGPGLRLAYPLARSGEAIGAIAVELEGNELAQQQMVTPILQWGNAWLELLLNQQASAIASNDLLSDMLKPVLHASCFQEAALAVVGLIAHRYGAQRVSLGICRGGRVQPLVLSGSSGFSTRSTLARQLAESMAEALAQGNSVRWPEEDSLLPAHRSLAETHTDGGVVSVVLHGINEDFGVLTLEKGKGERFSVEDQEAVDRSACILGPVLALKQAQERSLVSRIRTRTSELYSAFSTQHRVLVLAGLVAGFALLSFFLLGSASYRVGGPAELQGVVQRALIAPFDGYVAAAHARAGERVDSGFVLAELDDRELHLELRQLQGDLSELNKQYRKALAGLDHSEARILKAQTAQAQARVDLLQQQLDRTQLLAPFAAVVVSGDLSRSLGKPVERGEVLFELAPLDAYRVVVEVPDRDIATVAAGQRGSLVLAASPTEQRPIEVVILSSAPGSSREPGSFRVEARLLDTPADLRPGMRGVAKVEVGKRRRIWIWTHELIEWLRFQLWAWLP